jgi:hypothetical protein
MDSEAGIGRRTPYEVVFGVDRLGEREFPAIADEAARRGVPVARRDQFAGMERVGTLLQRLVPEDAEPAALDRHLEILFHCYHFWDAGCRLYACEEAVARALVDGPPALESWPPLAPHRSFYLELPRNLFWAAVAEDEPPEPAEGLFVAMDPDRPSAEVELLLVLGMRADRPGFSVVGLVADLDEARRLDEREAFAPDIPGADMAGLYSLRRSSEIVLLLLRLLWYLDVYPESLERVAGAGADRPHNTGRDLPTTLDHYRVRLVERSRG